MRELTEQEIVRREKLQNIKKPLIVNNGKEFVCIKDNNYEWIEVYPDNGKYVITIMRNLKEHLIK